MLTAKLTSKGQITIPKSLRDQMGLKPGDQVEFMTEVEGCYLLIPMNSPLSALQGCVSKPAKAVSVRTMNQVVKQRAVREHKKVNDRTRSGLSQGERNLAAIAKAIRELRRDAKARGIKLVEVSEKDWKIPK